MAGRFVRHSKYRHVFGTPYKREKCYDNIRITKSPHDSNMCAVNGKFLAVVLEAQGGGAFLVVPLSKVGRFDVNQPKVAGHRALVMDLSWNPFNENMIASCSEDGTAKLWEIPDAGISENMEEPTMTLKGHSKKVGYVVWHPCAEDVLATVGFDHKIIIWNTASGTQLTSLDGFHADIIYSMSWNYDGSLIATTCKDKKIRVLDPRKKELISEGTGHLGTKPSKVVFCGSTGKLFTSGFTRTSERQYSFWNPNDLSKPLSTENIDNGSGVLFPFWDEGTKMVYLCGKGDTSIRYFEVTEEAPYVFFLNMYQAKEPQRGVGCMPKRQLDYMQCEVWRFYKVTPTTRPAGFVEPISMKVPRKSEMFQDDIFPPCEAPIPALTADEWAAGENRPPRLLKFTEEGLETMAGPKVTTTVSAGRERTASSGRDRTPSSSSSKGPEPQTLEEYQKAYKELLAENEALRKKLEKHEGRSAYKRH